MDNDERRKLTTTLVSVYAYYGKDLSEVAVQFWIDDLSGHDMGAIERAFVRHRRDPERGRFLPLTADILRQLNGDDEESSLVAWGKVLAAAKDGGRRFDGVTGHALEAIGGMLRVRMSNPQEAGFLRREFCSAFKVYQHRQQREPMDAIGHDVQKLLSGIGKAGA
jgi:hypothetical protein